MRIVKGWSMRCGNHNYISLYYDGKFVHCYDNDLYRENPHEDEYYAEHIIAAIEKRAGMRIAEIPIIGSIKDFDGLRFLNGGFKKGADWLNDSQVVKGGSYD